MNAPKPVRISRLFVVMAAIAAVLGCTLFLKGPPDDREDRMASADEQDQNSIKGIFSLSPGQLMDSPAVGALSDSEIAAVLGKSQIGRL